MLRLYHTRDVVIRRWGWKLIESTRGGDCEKERLLERLLRREPVAVLVELGELCARGRVGEQAVPEALEVAREGRRAQREPLRVSQTQQQVAVQVRVQRVVRQRARVGELVGNVQVVVLSVTHRVHWWLTRVWRLYDQ